MKLGKYWDTRTVQMKSNCILVSDSIVAASRFYIKSVDDRFIVLNLPSLHCVAVRYCSVTEVIL